MSTYLANKLTSLTEPANHFHLPIAFTEFCFIAVVTEIGFIITSTLGITSLIISVVGFIELSTVCFGDSEFDNVSAIAFATLLS